MDPSGLGSFCSMVMTGGPTKVRFVRYYRPDDRNRNTHRRAATKVVAIPRVFVYTQHAHHHMKSKVGTDP